MKKLAAMMIVLALLTLGLQSAFADVYVYEGPKVTLTVLEERADGDDDYDEDEIEVVDLDENGNVISQKPETIDAQTFTVLGSTTDGRCLVFVNGRTVYVASDEIAQLFGGRLPDGLTNITGMAVIKRGASHDAIRSVQQLLIDLGYLEDYADGEFGQMTRGAIGAFQEAVGLEVTGEADAATQVLLEVAAGLQESIVFNGVADSELLAALDARCESDLSVFAEGFKVEYDDIAGTGFISNGNLVTVQVLGGADIDNSTFTLRFGFAVAEKNGEVTVKPQVKVECVAVRRPMMASLTLKSGDLRWTRAIAAITNGISGSRSVEKGQADMKSPAPELLAGAAEAGELKIRIKGKYQDYDITVPDNQLGLIAEVGRLAEAFLG